jgi:hypothetical protein
MGPIVRLVSLILVLGTWFAMSDSAAKSDKADARILAQAEVVSSN